MKDRIKTVEMIGGRRSACLYVAMLDRAARRAREMAEALRARDFRDADLQDNERGRA